MPPKRKCQVARTPMPKSKTKEKKPSKESKETEPYDWDIRARYFRTEGTQERWEYELDTDLEDIPTRPKEMHDFITQHEMNHGDIVQWKESYRDACTYFVIRRGTKMAFIPCEDRTMAGYLDIPPEVTWNVSDSLKKYERIIPLRVYVNIVLPPNDQYIQDNFGEVPGNWKFDMSWEFDDSNLETNTTPNVTHCSIETGSSTSSFDNLLDAKNFVRRRLGLDEVEEEAVVESDEDWSPGQKSGKRVKKSKATKKKSKT